MYVCSRHNSISVYTIVYRLNRLCPLIGERPACVPCARNCHEQTADTPVPIGSKTVLGQPSETLINRDSLKRQIERDTRGLYSYT